MGEDGSQDNEGGITANDRTVPQLGDDEFYRALASRTRRRLLYHLLEEGETSVDTLAAVLVEWETTRGTGVSNQDYDRTLTTLRHQSLPVLAEAGLVVYERDARTVRLESIDDEVASLLQASVDADASG